MVHSAQQRVVKRTFDDMGRRTAVVRTQQRLRRKRVVRLQTIATISFVGIIIGISIQSFSTRQQYLEASIEYGLVVTALSSLSGSSSRSFTYDSPQNVLPSRRPALLTASTTTEQQTIDSNDKHGNIDVTSAVSSRSSRLLSGLSIGSRVSYKRSVVGSEGGRPQITALDMVCNGDTDQQQLQQFDKNSFELHVGRALDTLRKDYPRILTDDPDYSIYDTHIEVVDPSGVRVRGLKSYKNAFRLIHALVHIVYCPQKSGLTMRMCYDQARQNIRIHWNAYVVPRDIFGGEHKTSFVDGISVYELDRYTGNITEHRIERLLINDNPVVHERGIVEALKEKYTVMIPSFIDQQQRQKQRTKGVALASNIIVPFQQANALRDLFRLVPGGQGREPSSLFALEATNDGTASSGRSYDEVDMESIRARYPTLDWSAYDSKNKSRKKFGLKPLSPEEYMEIESKVQQLATVQQEKMAQQQQAMQEAAEQAKKRKEGGLFQKILGNVLTDTCESNFDCERPEVCCDFGFQKRCCFSGSPVGRTSWDQMQPIRVPANVPKYPDDNDYPRKY